VLFKGPDFIGNGRVFPGGDLREPRVALARATAFVLVGGATELDSAGAGEFRNYLESTFPARPVFSVVYRPGALQPGNAMAVAQGGLAGSFLAFCGLARPGSFQAALAGLPGLAVGFQTFPDHHPYSAADLAALVRQAARLGGVALVTTSKDLVKLRHLACPLPLYVVPVELALPPGLAELLGGLF
jgi:tetraacyldisaccharide 4'-kinase